eukprot:Skav213471  [mRNA]  locus=scaffold3211:259623:260090:- [translate_table: standard]
MLVEFLVSCRVLDLCADLNFSTQAITDLVDSLLYTAEWPEVSQETRLALFRLARFMISVEFGHQLQSSQQFEEMKIIRFEFPDKDAAMWDRMCERPQDYCGVLEAGLEHCIVLEDAWPEGWKEAPLFRWLEESHLRMAAALQRLRQLRLMYPETC